MLQYQIKAIEIPAHLLLLALIGNYTSIYPAPYSWIWRLVVLILPTGLTYWTCHRYSGNLARKINGRNWDGREKKDNELSRLPLDMATGIS